MIISYLAIAMASVLATQTNYVKPIYNGKNEIVVTKPINIADSISHKKFIKIPARSYEVTYEDLKWHAFYNCKNTKHPSEDIIDTLIQVEKQFNPPPKMRGMILAAACMESGFNPNALGDRKFSKNKKKPMAIGILQLWPIYEKMFPGLDRRDPLSAADGWMRHIVRMIPKVKRQCKYRTQEKVWLAAWVTGIRYKKPGGRCTERPKHYRLLRKWHREIKKKATVRYECGC